MGTREVGMAASRGIMALALTIGLMPCAPAYAEEAGLEAASSGASADVSVGGDTDGYGCFAVSDEEGKLYAEEQHDNAAKCSIEQNGICVNESLVGLESAEQDGSASLDASIGTATTIENVDSGGNSIQEGEASSQAALIDTTEENDTQLFATEGKDYIAVVGKRYFNEAYEVLNQVNQQRAAAGLSALTMDKDLLNTAMMRAAETSTLFSHTRPTGQSCFTASNKMSAENIAVGQSNAAQVMNSWMNSEGHRNNILNSRNKSIGIGCFKTNGITYWVQCFGNGDATAVSSSGDDMGGYRIAYDGSYMKSQGAKMYIGAWNSAHTQFTNSGNITVPLGAEQEYEAVLVNGGFSNACVLLYHGDQTVNPVQTAGSDDNESWYSGGSWWFGAGAVGRYTLTVSLGTYGPAASVTHEVVGDAEEEASSSGAAKRLQGNTRYDTMRKISKQGFSSAETAIIASGENFPDALGASSLAGAYGAPILLSSPNSLSWQAKFEIHRLGVKNVYLIGGESALSSGVESTLEGMGVKVTRVKGSARQQTAAEVAKLVAKASKPTTAIIASGNAPWDSLSISSYAYAKNYPIFLAEGDGTLSNETLDALRSTGVTSVLIVGGKGVVGSIVETQLAQFSLKRLSGDDRYATSAEIAKYAIAEDSGISSSTVAVASGERFPDALSGAALLGKNNGVILLTDPSDGAPVASQISQMNAAGAVRTCYILGGKGAVGEGVENEINAVLD